MQPFSSGASVAFTQRCFLQRRNTSISSHGEPQPGWRTYATAWFGVSILQPAQGVAADQLYSEGNVRFVGYWVEGVQPGDRIVMDGGRTYDVVQAADMDGWRARIVIYARDQQNAD